MRLGARGPGGAAAGSGDHDFRRRHERQFHAHGD